MLLQQIKVDGLWMVKVDFNPLLIGEFARVLIIGILGYYRHVMIGKFMRDLLYNRGFSATSSTSDTYYENYFEFLQR